MAVSFERKATRDFYKSLILEKRRRMSPSARARNKTLRIPATWLYPQAVERSYFRYIRGIMEQVSEGVVETISKNLARWLKETDFSDGDVFDEYEDEFSALMEQMREEQAEIFVENEGTTRADVFGFGEATNIANAAQWDRVNSLAIGQSFTLDSGWVEPMLRNWSTMNFTLISSLTDEYIKKTNFIVAEGVQQGAIYTDIMKELRAMDKNMTRDRSELIARDQVGKLNGSLTEGRLLDAGVSSYVWSTALDERVRPRHRQMAGSTNKWGDRSVYKPRGSDTFIKRPSSMQGAIPGSQVQCRCTALAAFDDVVQEVDAFIDKELKENPELRFRATSGAF